jgi:hypothetical protein
MEISQHDVNTVAILKDDDVSLDSDRERQEFEDFMGLVEMHAMAAIHGARPINDSSSSIPSFDEEF